MRQLPQASRRCRREKAWGEPHLRKDRDRGWRVSRGQRKIYVQAWVDRNWSSSRNPGCELECRISTQFYRKDATRAEPVAAPFSFATRRKQARARQVRRARVLENRLERQTCRQPHTSAAWVRTEEAAW